VNEDEYKDENEDDFRSPDLNEAHESKAGKRA
jgi:hypothetical protein